MKLLKVAWSGWLIVALTALNVTQVSQQHYVGALIVGTAISYVWCGNSKRAALSVCRSERLAYAAGAGIGTVSGMFAGAIVAWLTR